MSCTFVCVSRTHPYLQVRCLERIIESYVLKSVNQAGQSMANGILLQKLFWPTVRKNCPRDREHFLKFEAEGQTFAKNWDD